MAMGVGGVERKNAGQGIHRELDRRNRCQEIQVQQGPQKTVKKVAVKCPATKTGHECGLIRLLISLI